MIIDNYPC